MTVPGIAVTMPSTSLTRLRTSSMLRNVPLATHANRCSPSQNTQSSRIMMRCWTSGVRISRANPVPPVLTRKLSSKAGLPVSVLPQRLICWIRSGWTMVVGTIVASSTAHTATSGLNRPAWNRPGSMNVFALATMTVRPSMRVRNASLNVVSPTARGSLAPRRESPYMARVMSWMPFTASCPNGRPVTGCQPPAAAWSARPGIPAVVRGAGSW